MNVYLVGIDGNMIGYPALNHTFQRFPPSSAASVSVSNGVVTASGLWRKFGEGIPDRRPASSRRHRCGIAGEIYSAWRDGAFFGVPRELL